tara:strand:+ start:430 stop:1128 length:699 start_codon:yes stop_codon:yes gene_type:complete
MHILLTRPLEDSIDMILKFKNLGHEVSHIPLISIEEKKYENVNFNEFKGIIFTSANAIKFLDLKMIDKKISCFCVGSATEKKARNNGFQNVFPADGNVNNLKEIIFQNFDKSDGKLIYVSGETISNALDQQLISKGYNIKRIINYSALPIDYIDENTLDKIKISRPDIIYVYSEKCAINLKNLIKKYSLVDKLINCNLMCISEKTSRVLNGLKWKKIFIFNPGEEEFLLYKI